MQEHVTLRNFQSSDYEAIRDVIRETWQYDRFCSQRTAPEAGGGLSGQLPRQSDLYADSRCRRRSRGYYHGEKHRQTPMPFLASYEIVVLDPVPAVFTGRPKGIWDF